GARLLAERRAEELHDRVDALKPIPAAPVIDCRVRGKAGGELVPALLIQTAPVAVLQALDRLEVLERLDACGEGSGVRHARSPPMDMNQVLQRPTKIWVKNTSPAALRATPMPVRPYGPSMFSRCARLSSHPCTASDAGSRWPRLDATFSAVRRHVMTWPRALTRSANPSCPKDVVPSAIARLWPRASWLMRGSRASGARARAR